MRRTAEHWAIHIEAPDPILLTGPVASATVDFSLVEDEWSRTGNLDGYPSFLDPLGGNYRLGPGSPCIDATDNFAVPPGLLLDLRGAPRFLDDPFTLDTARGDPPAVDMGTYEFAKCDVGAGSLTTRPTRRPPAERTRR